jgi:hypothetical protein
MGGRIQTLLGLAATAILIVIVVTGPDRGLSAGVPAASTANAYRGTGSCSATACHGGNQPAATKVLRNEHTTWIASDRHANAYKALFDPRSKSIAARLSGGRTPAHEDARCLACHATPVRAAEREQASALLSDGVGCESCHGPADRWIGEHTRLDWAERTDEDKERLGMISTADLARRAKVCAGCHVGEPARDGFPLRDVDHDLIAAGHPRLNFEFSAYAATMPRHWRDDTGPDATPEFPARAWSVGQFASAEAALDLLRDRAERSRTGRDRTPPAVWPEFSEYACFSCHHDLRDDSWRRERTNAPSPLRWGTWHFPIVEVLTSRSKDAGDARLADLLKDLKKLMIAPQPDAAQVARRAELAARECALRLAKVSKERYDSSGVQALLTVVSGLSKDGGIAGWDQATQRYLALVPLNQALRSLAPGPSDSIRTEELNRLRAFLKFPKGYDSPKSFNPDAVPSALRSR